MTRQRSRRPSSAAVDQASAVRIEKRLIEEQDSVEVTLRHDELDLESGGTSRTNR